jgi:hypothetical protein
MSRCKVENGSPPVFMLTFFMTYLPQAWGGLYTVTCVGRISAERYA